MAENKPTRRMGSPGGGFVPGEKAGNFRQAMKKLIAYMGTYHLALLVVAVIAVGATVFNVLGPKLLGGATTILAEGMMHKISGTGSIDFGAIARQLLLTLGLYVISTVLLLVQGFMMTGITQKICYRLRRDVVDKIGRMPMRYFESRTHGEVLSHLTNDVDALSTGMNQSITQLVTSVATILGVLVMMLTISPIMTLITLVLLPISAVLIALVVRFSQKYFMGQQEYLGKINGQVEEIYSGHSIVQAFGQEEAVSNDFRTTNDQLLTAAWKSQFISGLMHPIMVFVGNLGYVGVALSGALLAAQGRITIGGIQAFIQYSRNFTQPIQQIAQIMNLLQSMAAAAERVFAFLVEDEEEQSGDYHPENIRGAVDFDHVRFGYDPEQVIVHDFCATVEPGRKIAIVGPTGAGKTTMVKLLMRYYDVQGGSIRLDGRDIREFDRRDLRNAFGMVLQETWLFQGTIMENLRYGRVDATDEEVMSAAKAARVHHFIMTLPGGYQMELNEEASNISQGQKQLLTIARAILADRPVLILDEATSSVDTRTEAQIQQAMDTLIAGRTSFIIAHRLSTIRGADLILCMKDGDIVEQGTHDELMEKDAFYAGLYNSQFEQV